MILCCSLDRPHSLLSSHSCLSCCLSCCLLVVLPSHVGLRCPMHSSSATLLPVPSPCLELAIGMPEVALLLVLLVLLPSLVELHPVLVLVVHVQV